jgi:hypothetical protein
MLPGKNRGRPLGHHFSFVLVHSLGQDYLSSGRLKGYPIFHQHDWPREVMSRNIVTTRAHLHVNS